MLELVLALIVVCVIATILMHHHFMKKQLHEGADIDAQLIRNAARGSLRASKYVDTFFAVRELDRAQQTLEDLLVRRQSNAEELAGVDVVTMLKEVTAQKAKVLEHHMEKHPEPRGSQVPESVRRMLRYGKNRATPKDSEAQACSETDSDPDDATSDSETASARLS